jgi:hypothetical protein
MPIQNGPVSSPPSRVASGFATDPPFWPLAHCGVPNPFFYHVIADDFEGVDNIYTVTATGGSVASSPGDGGLITFTTGATASSNASLQPTSAGFVLPGTGATPPGSSLSTKKLFYLARVTVGHTTDGFIAGLGNISATPFTAGVDSMVDGLYFYKAPTVSTLSLINRASAGNSPTGGAVLNTFVLPGITIVAGTSFDLGLYIDRYQNIRVWVAPQLVGYVPQSGSGPTTADGSGVTVTPIIGPIFANYNYQAQSTTITGQSVTNPLVFSTAPLAPTLAITNGTTAAATTLIADFQMAAKER